MDSDLDLAARFDAAVGDEPEHRPLGSVVRRGRRRVLMRRAGGVLVAAAVVTVLGFAVAGGADDQARDLPPAGDPTPPTVVTDPPVYEFEGQLATATFEGEVVVNPRAVITARAEVRYRGRVGYLFEGRIGNQFQRQFVSPDTGVGASTNARDGDLRAWGARQLRTAVDSDDLVPAPEGLVTVREGRLEATAGVVITDQVDGDELADLGVPGELSAAARFTYRGRVYFLVAGTGGVFAVEEPRAVNTLETWVDFLQDQDAFGIGLR